MSVQIYFFNNSIRNTILSCESLGIQYTFSKPDRVLSLTRWDEKSQNDVLIGQFEMPFIRGNKVRVGQDGQWQPMKTFLKKGDAGFRSQYAVFLYVSITLFIRLN